MSSPPVRPSNTISKLNTSVDGGRRYKGILTFTGPTELTGKVTIDPGYLLDDVVPTEFGARRHERSPSPGDEPIPCEFGIYRLRGLDYYVHSVTKPGTNKLVIPPTMEAPSSKYVASPITKAQSLAFPQARASRTSVAIGLSALSSFHQILFPSNP